METTRNRTSAHRRSSFLAAAWAVLGLGIPGVSASSTCIDFEGLESGVVVRDHFLALGLEVTGTGALTGQVFSENTNGIQNFGNSPTQVVHVGYYGESTTLWFVDPMDPGSIIGARQFSIIMGDGDQDIETFEVTFRDPHGLVLLGPFLYTTQSEGLTLSEDEESLGGLIGSIQLRLMPNSASGVVFDDLCFDRACREDIDSSGDVGIADLLVLLAAWGPAPGHAADFNSDGIVGITDLLQLLANWGACT